MEQRTYQTEVDPQELADFLVQHYDPKENLQAQKIGQSGSNLVQIGRGDVPQDLRHAVTVAIAHAGRGDSELKVTMGQQQWLTPGMATFAAMMGLIGILIMPFALFALLWPISEAAGSATLPPDIWNTIDTYIAGRGGSLSETKDLSHPHAH